MLDEASAARADGVALALPVVGADARSGCCLLSTTDDDGRSAEGGGPIGADCGAEARVGLRAESLAPEDKYSNAAAIGTLTIASQTNVPAVWRSLSTAW